MEETEWSREEVKRLKWKQLFQVNIVYLLVFFLSIYFIKTGVSLSLYFIILCIILWLMVASYLYTVITGKPFGTKTSRRLQRIAKEKKGEKSWKRKKMIELIAIAFFVILCTVLIVTMEFRTKQLDIYTVFPIIGAFLGMNIGEIVRIGKL